MKKKKTKEHEEVKCKPPSARSTSSLACAVSPVPYLYKNTMRRGEKEGSEGAAEVRIRREGKEGTRG